MCSPRCVDQLGPSRFDHRNARKISLFFSSPFFFSPSIGFYFSPFFLLSFSPPSYPLPNSPFFLFAPLPHFLFIFHFLFSFIFSYLSFFYSFIFFSYCLAFPPFIPYPQKFPSGETSHHFPPLPHVRSTNFLIYFLFLFCFPINSSTCHMAQCEPFTQVYNMDHAICHCPRFHVAST